MVAGNIFGAKDAHPHVQMQASGRVMHGNGPPHVLNGHAGNIYIDRAGRKLYLKVTGSPSSRWTGTWRHILDISDVDNTLLDEVRFYSDAVPSPNLGVEGDYCFVWHCDNAQTMPRLFGPKTGGAWAEKPIFGLTTAVAPW